MKIKFQINSMLKDKLKIPYHEPVVSFEVIKLAKEKETLQKENQNLAQQNIKLARNFE